MDQVQVILESFRKMTLMISVVKTSSALSKFFVLNSAAFIFNRTVFFVLKYPNTPEPDWKKSANYNLVLPVLVRQPKHSQSWLADSL